MLAPRYRWEVAAPAPASLFSSVPECHRVVVQLLYNRGYRSGESIQGFLAGQDAQEHDPFLLAGMQEAVDRIHRAIRAGERIGVFGDYDADGVSAAVIMQQALTFLGATVEVRLPHRVHDGYGLTERAVAALADRGVGLLITVDCGISAVGPVALARKQGMDVIVTDHHQPPAELPAAHAIINPWLPACDYPFRELCGAGLAYKLACALLSTSESNAVESMQGELRGFAAIATVADVVPLLGENRAIVLAGIEALRRTEHAGLRALMQVAGVEAAAVDSGVIGFALAPRINAAGRMAHPGLAFDLLTSRDRMRALALATQLQQLNQERQRVTKRALTAARRQVERGQQDESLLWVEGKNWGAGIIGLVAGRLADEYGRPALAVAVDGAAAVGSARSIPEYDIAAALAERGSLMQRHGGHRQAAGFSLEKDKRSQLREALQDDARQSLDPTKVQPRLQIDEEAPAQDMDLDLLATVGVLAPFGASNPEPSFVSRGLQVSGIRPVGTDHLRTTFAVGRRSITGIGFHMADRAPHLRVGQELDVVYSMQENTWGGFSRLEFRLQDMQMTGADGETATT